MKRQNYCRAGMGSYDPVVCRPTCFYRVQMRRGSLMFVLGRQRVPIRKSAARGVEIDQREEA